ncbi:NAD-dependent epimerase/dehydratase family protein [Candidatus Daviesbacteria bacterium]|nr:NAD-dependent epimerase/dehydratase family protein [Candidatus Daviesbacteria bacterium]
MSIIKYILVTGSGGLIGSEAVNFFCKNDYQVVGIDNNMRAYYFGNEGSTHESIEKHQKIYKNYKHFNIDIREKEAIEEIFRKYKFDLIIHTAAQPSHDWAAKEPLTDFSVNANGTLILLENFRKYSSEGVFIFTSTNKVYGDNPNFLPLVENKTRFEIDSKHKYKNGITEDMPLDNTTHSLFGVSKAAADLMVQEYGRYFNLKTGIFRGGCLTGSGHAGVQQHGFLSYLVKCIVTGRKYTIFGYKGKQVRDNIHAHDLINAFYHFYQKPHIGEVYNIGGSRFANISMLEAIKKIEDISDRKSNIEYIDQNRIGDHIWYVSCIDKFKNSYPDWKYEYDIDATIEDICRNSYFAKKVFSFSVAKNLDYWREKNWYYHNLLRQIFKEAIPEGSKVLQVGYGLGDILASLFPKKGVSIDVDDDVVTVSKRRYPYIKFLKADPEKIGLKNRFDYAIFPNSVDHFTDIQLVLERVSSVLNNKGKIVIAGINPRWEQIFYILEKLNLKRNEPPRNWLRIENLKNLVTVSGYEVTDYGFRILVPMHIPVISRVINRLVKNVKFLSRFCVEQYVVGEKKKIVIDKKLTTSIIIPHFNQYEDLKKCLQELPKIGKKTEVVLVDYGSDSNIVDLVKRLIKGYKNIEFIATKCGRKEAIKLGLNAASGDIFIIYEAEMGVPATELVSLYKLLASKQADFVNGTRHIYPLKGQRLRQLNIIVNLLFGWFYTWLLGQQVTDLLCNVKALCKEDYAKLKINGKIDSNFDLLFAAATNNLKIVELPVHYRKNFSAKSNIELFKHIVLLVQMGLFGLWSMKIKSLLKVRTKKISLPRGKKLILDLVGK